ALVETILKKIKHCPDCQCLMEENHCSFCDLGKRESQIICIISSAKDAFSIEETRAYKGLYHVLGGLLSPIDGRTPDHLQLDKLKKRVDDLSIKEVIIALDSTLEGDATALYLKEHVSLWGIRVSRLAFGLPMGSSLDFVDGGTLQRALTGRQAF
ncbi:MAG: recombination mediator RecR, partial [Anaerolineae bacterium]